jgi:hypothetical protein
MGVAYAETKQQDKLFALFNEMQKKNFRVGMTTDRVLVTQ